MTTPDQTYLIAMAVYAGSALLALGALFLWLRASWPPVWRWLLLLTGLALLLTPAYPYQGVDTLAPALIVAAFQFLTAGPEAAQHALRPLAAALTLALVLTLLLRITVLRKPRVATGP